MEDNVEMKTLKKKVSVLDLIIRYRTILILLLLVAIFTIIKPIFLHPTNLLNMLKSMSYVAIAAFGTTFVITLGGLDLSVGSTAAVVGVSFALILGLGVPLFPAILICFVIAMALGAINGVVIVKGKIEPFLVTLATLNIYRGLALLLTSGRPVPIVSEFFVKIFGNGFIFKKIPIPILIMAIFFGITLFLYKKTKFRIRYITSGIRLGNIS